MVLRYVFHDICKGKFKAQLVHSDECELGGSHFRFNPLAGGKSSDICMESQAKRRLYLREHNRTAQSKESGDMSVRIA